MAEFSKWLETREKSVFSLRETGRQLDKQFEVKGRADSRFDTRSTHRGESRPFDLHINPHVPCSRDMGGEMHYLSGEDGLDSSGHVPLGAYRRRRLAFASLVGACDSRRSRLEIGGRSR